MSHRRFSDYLRALFEHRKRLPVLPNRRQPCLQERGILNTGCILSPTSTSRRPVMPFFSTLPSRAAGLNSPTSSRTARVIERLVLPRERARDWPRLPM
ncbi:MAG: hypothetical protein MZV64_04190 [Ignavibacteriales bacterium]|nr:hypothetical protein [Ignavibacteriales bacterium]